MKVYIPRRIADEGLSYLTERGYEVRLGSAQDEETMIREITDCDALIIRIDPVTKAVIDAAPRLRVIARHGVGLDNIDVAYATARGIWVTNSPLSNAGAVAEHTIMLMLLLARRVQPLNAMDPGAAFLAYQQRLGMEISGKTLGIIGYGRIGQQTARIVADGFGMRVLAWSRRMADKPRHPGVRFAETPEEIYRQADFVSLHMALNEQTRNFLGKDAFALMKPDAYLINTAREELVNREALLSALENGQIAGAGIDFCADDASLPYLRALVDTDKVLVTPHSGSMTKDAMKRMALHAAQGVHEVLSGQMPTWPVNEPCPPGRAG